MHRLRAHLLATTALLSATTVSVLGNPLAPHIAAGDAKVRGLGTDKVTVKQSSDKAIIDWQSFDIAPGETTVFDQPGRDSVTLNRVTGGEGASEILGTLKADGQIFIVNRDGILFGKDAVVDVGALVASTHDLLNRDFMAGRYNFDRSGNPSASVVNLGTITVDDGGYAALVAPGVRNAGTVRARLGKISMASADRFTLDLYGDNLIRLAVDDSTAGRVIDLETGRTLEDLVANSGLLSANGGTVELSASAARKVINSVINNTGVIEADSIGKREGKIVLSAATAKTKSPKLPGQKVEVSGTLSASGEQRGETGGAVEITGELIELTVATIDAFGWKGGGTVLIGGDLGGGDATHFAIRDGLVALEDHHVATASAVVMDAASMIDVSALRLGDGGKAIIWADEDTKFVGSIAARGGSRTGDGGFVEVSGHQRLAFSGGADTGATSGRNGTLLLDPVDVTIGTVGQWVVTPTSIQAALVNNDVVIKTAAGAGNGDITVAAPITWSSGNSLTLSAYRNVVVNADLTSAGGADVVLRADETGRGVGTVLYSNSAEISTAGDVDLFFNPSVNPAGSGINLLSYVNPIEDYSGLVTGGGTLTPFMLVNSIYDLQNVANKLDGRFALGRNIDASQTASWNGGLGFIPIGFDGPGGRAIHLPDGGTLGGWFSGSLEGNGHSISNLHVHRPADEGLIDNYSIGLFGETGSLGFNDPVISNLRILDADISGPGMAGILAGSNLDTRIFNVHTSGRVEGTTVGGLLGGSGGSIARSSSSAEVWAAVVDPNTWVANQAVGGLVGAATGTIAESFASGDVHGDTALFAGGLVGAVSDAEIRDSYALGDVTTDVYAGGLLGLAIDRPVVVTSSYSIGTADAGWSSGGLVGRADTISVLHAYWDTDNSQHAGSPQGSGMTTAQLKSGLPAGFDPTIWGIDPNINDGYPYLLWETAAAPIATVLTPSTGPIDPDPPDPPDPPPPPPDTPILPPPDFGQLPVQLPETTVDLRVAYSTSPYVDTPDGGLAAFLLSQGLDFAKGQVISELSKLLSRELFTELVGLGLIAEADTAVLSQLVNSKFIAVLAKNPDGWKSLGVGLLIDIMKGAAMDAIREQLARRDVSPYLVEPSMYVLSTMVDSVILTVKYPAMGPEYVALAATTKNTFGQLIKAFDASGKLLGTIGDLRDGLRQLEASADALYRLGMEKRLAGDREEARRLFELSVGVSKSAQSLRQQYTAWGVSILDM